MPQWSIITIAFFLALLSGLSTAQDLLQFDLLIRAERFEEVVPKLQEYLQAQPDSIEASYQLGYACFRLRRMTEAVKSLSACLSRKPDHPEAHRVLGLALTALGRPDLAEREFVRALQLRPESAETYYALGRLQFERGGYKAAAEALKRTIENQPSHVKAQETLGLAYEALNDIESARRHMAAAIELNEKSPQRSEWPYVSFAGFHNRRGDYEAALRYAKQASAIEPGSDAAHFQAAKAYCGLRRWRECAAEVQAAIRIDDKNPEFFYLLSTAHRRSGNPEESKASLENFHRLKKWEAATGGSLRAPQ